MTLLAYILLGIATAAFLLWLLVRATSAVL
jgi:hypothetical protein